MSITDIRELSIRISLYDENLVEKLESINQIVETTKIHFQELAIVIEDMENQEYEMPKVPPKPTIAKPKVEPVVPFEPPQGAIELEGAYVSKPQRRVQSITRPESIEIESAGISDEITKAISVANKEFLSEQEVYAQTRLEQESQQARELFNSLQSVYKDLSRARRGREGRIQEETAERIFEEVREAVKGATGLRQRVEEEQDPTVKIGMMKEYENVWNRLERIAANLEQRISDWNVVQEEGETVPFGEQFVNLRADLNRMIGSIPELIDPEDLGESIGRSVRSYGGAEEIVELRKAVEMQTMQREVEEGRPLSTEEEPPLIHVPPSTPRTVSPMITSPVGEMEEFPETKRMEPETQQPTVIDESINNNPVINIIVERMEQGTTIEELQKVIDNLPEKMKEQVCSLREELRRMRGK